MKYIKPVIASCTFLWILACHPAPETPLEDEWVELRSLLDDCAGEYSNENRPKEVLTTYLTDAPILGNGEIGLVLGGDDKKQTFYLNRNDNWAWALGGVSISANHNGEAPEFLSYSQQILHSSITGKLNLNGNPVDLECRIAVDEPLALATITNKSNRPVEYQITTWSRPQLDEKGRPREGKPFYLMPWNWNAGHTISEVGDAVETIPFSHEQGTWPAESNLGNPFWTLIRADDKAWYIQNVQTQNFLVAVDDGSLETVAILRGDKSGLWEINPVYMGFLFRNVKLGNTMAHHNNQVRVKEFESDKSEHRSWERKELRWQFQSPEGYIDPSKNRIRDDIVSTYRENRQYNYLSRAGISTRILGGEVSLRNGIHHVRIQAGESCTLAMAVTGDGGRFDRMETVETYLEDGRKLLCELSDHEVAELDRKRKEWWKNYWLKCWVDLGDRKLNQYWYGAYHALACASRPGGDEMPSLWGPWVTIDNPNWGNDHYNNYNHISPYFGIFSGNRCELIEPYVENQMAYLSYFKNRTRKAGYRGVVFPRVTSRPETLGEPEEPAGISKIKNRDLLFNDQLDAAIYIGLNLFFYYDFTQDQDFLREKAYPYALECIDFFEDYLEFENGRYVLYRSGAREGTGEDINPAYPLGYIRRLCEFVLSASERFDCDAARRQKWLHILENISDYPTTTVNGKVLFREAESRQEVSMLNNGVHDNASRLQFIYPGEQLGLESDPYLLEVAHNSWTHLNSKPGVAAWLQGNNFPIVLPQVVRIGVDPGYLYPQIIRSLETCFRENLTVFIFGGGIENCGATEAFNSMLMQSHEGSMKLFPVWLRSVDAKFHRLRAKGAFLISSEIQGGEIQYVDIFCEKGGDLYLQNPWPGSRIQFIREDTKSEIKDVEIIKLETSKNQEFRLEPIVETSY